MITDLFTLTAVTVMWSLRYLGVDALIFKWLELLMLYIGCVSSTEIIFKMWMRLEEYWRPRWRILLYGVMSAAMAAAVFFLFLPRPATWYELSVVITFFAHGVFHALMAHCRYDGCENDKNRF